MLEKYFFLLFIISRKNNLLIALKFYQNVQLLLRKPSYSLIKLGIKKFKKTELVTIVITTKTYIN